MRVRPFSERELEQRSACAVSVAANATVVQVGSQLQTFEWHLCFESLDPNAESSGSQAALFEAVGADVLPSAFEGHEGCILAYGGRGSGKTYTLFGTSDDPGVIHRSAEALFQRGRAGEQRSFPSADGAPAAPRAGPECDLRVWASFFEVRNEHVRDLLAARGHCSLRVTDHPQLGVCVSGLSEIACASADDVGSLLGYGSRRRAAMGVLLCEDPSRGHIVVSLRVQLRPAALGDESVAGPSAGHFPEGRIHFVDLAAAERAPLCAPTAAVGGAANCGAAALLGGRAASHGLTALHLVVRSLSSAGKLAGGAGTAGRPLAPFNASKLTLFLRAALSGPAVALVATVSPAASAVPTTLRTLAFAAAAGQMAQPPASEPRADTNELVRWLQADIRRLRALVPQRGLVPGISAPAAEALELHEELADRGRRLRQLRGLFVEQLDEAAGAEELREEALRDLGLLEPGSGGQGQDELPLLLNVSSDDMLAGCLAYMLARGVTTVGSHPDSGIVVKGLGITPRHCQFEVATDGSLHISLLLGTPPRARIHVNGVVVRPGERVELHSMDRIVLGRARALCVVLPGSLDGYDSQRLEQSCLERDPSKLLLPDSSEAWSELRLYFGDLWQRLGEERGREFFGYLAEASHLVDEANEITTELRPQEHLKFEVELVWDINREVRDIIVIRYMQYLDIEDVAPPVLGYWALPRFREKVELMRDCFDTRCRTGEWRGMGDPLEDPWLSPSYVQLELQARLGVHARLTQHLRPTPAAGAFAAALAGSAAAKGGTSAATPAGGVAAKGGSAVGPAGGVRRAAATPSGGGGAAAAGAARPRRSAGHVAAATSAASSPRRGTREPRDAVQRSRGAAEAPRGAEGVTRSARGSSPSRQALTPKSPPSPGGRAVDGAERSRPASRPASPGVAARGGGSGPASAAASPQPPPQPPPPRTEPAEVLVARLQDQIRAREAEAAGYKETIAAMQAHLAQLQADRHHATAAMVEPADEPPVSEPMQPTQSAEARVVEQAATTELLSAIMAEAAALDACAAIGQPADLAIVT